VTFSEKSLARGKRGVKSKKIIEALPLTTYPNLFDFQDVMNSNVHKSS
jgi:hypothetical protein